MKIAPQLKYPLIQIFLNENNWRERINSTQLKKEKKKKKKNRTL